MPLPPVPPHRPRARRGGRPLRAVECVLLGDGAVGKTSLALSYSTNGFPARYVPTGLDRFSAVVQVDGAPIRLQLCDTAGQDELDALWPACCPKADVCLLCFSVVAPTSFRNVVDKWYPQEKPVPPSAGRSLARKLGLDGYVECSALTQQNLKEVFDTAIALGLRAAEGPKGQRAPPSCIWALSRDWWNKYLCVR
ncbi:rho-related GTP-binding protein RhoU-like isoform X4 [Erythrolamprus reginae]|uniref:rho-related GTP-binding protein RhoU-like isoform X4 n=1 Tax=Erythrolamprus reginae TaxID=121349 RepID=UPI00396C6955